MKVKLSAVALIVMIVPGQVSAATLTDAEATFLDQLVTAAAVLEQRCTGYEAHGAGAIQSGARLLGSPDAAMAMINAFDAAIQAYDGKDHDPGKFRPEVSEAAIRTSKRVLADLINNRNRACSDYGDISVERGMLRRY